MTVRQHNDRKRDGQTMTGNFIKKWKTWKSKMTSVLKGGAFLCDSCKWDYGTICTRPERPNARSCPDYTKK